MTKELDDKTGFNDKTVFSDKTVFNDKTDSNTRIDLNGGSKMSDLNNGAVNSGDASGALTFDANTGAVSCDVNAGAVSKGVGTAGEIIEDKPLIDDKPLSEYSFCKWLICDRQGNILDLRTDTPTMAVREFYEYAKVHSLTPFVEKYEMLQTYNKETEAWVLKTLIMTAVLAVAGRYIWNHFL